MKKEKKALNVKIICMIIISILFVAAIGGFVTNYGAPTTQSIGTNVEATFNSSTGNLTIRSTSGKGTINKTLFDDFKEEIDVYDIETLTIENAVYAPQDSSELFKDFSYCTSITGLTNLDTSNVTNMSSMFAYCEELTSIELNFFNTVNVTDMSYMFQDCSGLTSLNVSSLDTTNVTDMSGMFTYCESLVNLNLSTFITRNVTKMRSMFNECNSLTSINLTGFNTEKVTDMRSLFENCRAIETINLSMFNTSRVTDMACMFMGCESLTSVNLSSFNTTQAVYLDSMFRGCSSLEYLDLTSFDMSNVYKREFFNGCTSLMEIFTPYKSSSDVDLPGTFYDMEWEGEDIHTCTNFVFVHENNAVFHLGRIFVITFYPNNGSSSGKEQLKKYNENTQLEENTFTYPSHRFVSWNTKSDGSGGSYLDKAIYNENKDLTLYAQWEAGVYTVTLDNQDPTTEGSTSVEATIGYAMPEIILPQKTGYTFSGYFINRGGTGTKYYNANGTSAKNWDIDEETTLYAYWVENTYTISFNSNGGTGTMNDITGVRYLENKTLPMNRFTKLGYTFKDWVDSNLIRYDDEATVSKLSGVNGATVILYAEWEKDTYTITYNLNNGTVSNPNPETYQVDSSTINLNAPTRVGYTFTGWTGSNGNSPQVNVSIPTGSTGNRTYNANWTPNQYTIEYNLDGGKLLAGETNPTTGRVDEDVNIEYEPTKTGYTFAGWASTTNLGLGSHAKTGSSASPYVSWNGNVTKNHHFLNLREDLGTITMYAIWDPIVYNIAYNLDGGALAAGKTNPSTGTYDKKVEILNQPTKAGYTFAGWASNEDDGLGANAKTGESSNQFESWLGQAIDNQYFKNLRDTPGTVKLTAIWAPIVYNITYILDGGTNDPSNPSTYQTNSDTINIKPPTRLGYDFLGWTGSNGPTAEVNVTIPTGSTGYKTYTANWNPITYTILYNLDGGALAAGVSNPSSGTFDINVIIANHPTKAGFKFAGWTSSEGSGLETHAKTGVDASVPQTWEGSPTKNRYYLNLRDEVGTVTLTANWTPITYSIEYDLDEGELETGKTNPTSSLFNADVNIENHPTKIGYVFTGWTTSENDGLGLYARTGTSANPNTSWNGSLTKNKYFRALRDEEGTVKLTANWTPIRYTIEYDLNGGTLEAGKTNPAVGTYDVDVNIQNYPTRAGYIFTGWTTSEDDGLELHAKTGIDTTQYASWAGGLTKNKYYKNLRENQGTVTLTANWTPITYTIAYNLDGGALEAGKTNPTSSLFDVDVNIENHPTKYGYTFTGWTTSEDDGLGLNAKTGTSVNPTATWSGTSTKNKYYRNLRDEQGTVTLTANWAENAYNIAFNSNGGEGTMTTLTGIRYSENRVLTQNAFTKDGYIFKGWATTFDGEKVYDDEQVVSGLTIVNDETITLYAVWEKITYSITYILNDGTNNPLNPSSYQVDTPTIYIQPASRIGYTFTGWAGSNGTMPQVSVTIPTGSTGNKVFEANWTPIVYIIEYDLNGGTLDTGKSNPTIGIFDQDVNIENHPSKDGYVFTGWSTSIYDGLESTALTSVSANPTAGWSGSLTNNKYYKNLRCTTGTVKLTANYSEITYNIAFDNNGGTGYMSTMTGIRYAESKALSSNTFTKDGYVFKGWSLTPDGEKVYDDRQIISRLTNVNGATITLYAIWEKETYTITYVLNGGTNSPLNPSTYQVDTPTIYIQPATKEGYIFKGWTGSNGSIPQTNPILPIGSTGNKAYIANWEPNEYRILYNLNGGTLAQGRTNPSTAKVDEDVNVANQPTKQGYIFTGWTSSNSAGLEANATTSTTSNPEASWDGSLTTNKYYKNLRTNSGTVTLTANFIPDPNTKYTIKYYMQTLDTEIESYSEDQTLRDQKSATTGTLVELQISDLKEIPGFTFAEGNSKNKLSGTVKADGSLVLEVYYTRNTYNIRYETNGGTMSSTTSRYYYGKRFILSKNVRKGSSAFLGWYDNSEFTGNAVTYVEAGEIGDKIFYARWGDNSTLYVVSKDNKCIVEEGSISKITPNTKLSDLPNRINTNGNIVVKDKNGRQIGNNDLIGTGYTITVSLNGQTKTFEASVLGDVDGNGKVSMVDIVKANQAVLGKLSLTSAQKKAADVSGDSKLTLVDIVKMNQAYLGKVTL